MFKLIWDKQKNGGSEDVAGHVNGYLFSLQFLSAEIYINIQCIIYFSNVRTMNKLVK